MTAFNNNRQLEQYGKAAAALNSNVANAKDNTVAAKLESDLQKAEARGAIVAGMGFAGSSGASFEAIEGSMRLKQAREAQNSKSNLNQLNYNAAQERLGLIDNGLMGLDMTVHSGSVNTSQLIPAVTGGTNYASAFAKSGVLDQLGRIVGSFSPGDTDTANSGLGLKLSGSYGLKAPSASTSWFNIGNPFSIE